MATDLLDSIDPGENAAKLNELAASLAREEEAVRSQQLTKRRGRTAGEEEITCPKQAWLRFGVWLQEAVDMSRYDVLDEPELRGRKAVLARKRPDR